MTKQETLQKINDGLAAIKEYKARPMTKTAGGNMPIRESIDETISLRAAEFIEEAYSLGPSGSVCSKCGGSGRG